MTPVDDTASRADIARLEGKLDAYAAGQSARLDAHEHRLNGHDDDIKALRETTRPARTSGWQVASVVVAGVVGLGSLVGLLVALMQVVARAGG